MYTYAPTVSTYVKYGCGAGLIFDNEYDVPLHIASSPLLVHAITTRGAVVVWVVVAEPLPR